MVKIEKHTYPKLWKSTKITFQSIIFAFEFGLGRLLAILQKFEISNTCSFGQIDTVERDYLHMWYSYFEFSSNFDYFAKVLTTPKINMFITKQLLYKERKNFNAKTQWLQNILKCDKIKNFGENSRKCTFPYCTEIDLTRPKPQLYRLCLRFEFGLGW